MIEFELWSLDFWLYNFMIIVFVGAIVGIIIIILSKGNNDRAYDKGSLGDKRQRIVYEHVLETETTMMPMTTGTGTITMMPSTRVTKKQEVLVNEEYKVNKWYITKVELR